jgi:lipid A 3-O-deacylase
VADLAAGVSVNWRNTKLSYAFLCRTREFEGQDDGRIFGSLAMTINF